MTEEARLFVYELIGKKLDKFMCEIEMLELDFGKKHCLHALGCTRIIKNNDILVTTIDFQSWDREDPDHNDEWYNAKRFNDQIVGGTVTGIEISPLNDLFINLDNGVRIECYVANAYPHYEDECEHWVLFEPCEDKSNKELMGKGRFLCVMNKQVEFTNN